LELVLPTLPFALASLAAVASFYLLQKRLGSLGSALVSTALGSIVGLLSFVAWVALFGCPICSR